MAEYLPPTENVAIFDTLNFNDGNAPLTYNKAVKYFLRYPNAQGTENLQITNINGLLTANAGINTDSIQGLSLANVLNIGTETERTGSINIGTGASTVTSRSITIGNTNGITGTTSILGRTLQFGNSSTVGLTLTTTGSGGINIGTTQTTASMNIGTGSRSYSSGVATGSINIGTGTATGSGPNGCILNIGTGNRTLGSAINIGTGTNDAFSGVNIGNGANSVGIINMGTLGKTPLNINGEQIDILGGAGMPLNITTTGIGTFQASAGVNIRSTNNTINIGDSQVAGSINIGTNAGRPAGAPINIGTTGGSSAPINIGKLTISAPSASGSTLSMSGTNYLNITTTITDVTAGIRIGHLSTGGQHLYSNDQTTGYIKMGTTNRSYLDATSTGGIDIGTGSATGLLTNGCVMNIGTGARTVNSSINIGTGTRDNTSDINIGTGLTNAGHLHLQDGNNNTGNVHIANGTSNAGNVNICNNGGTGVINMGALGRAVEFSSTYTQASDFYRLGWYDLTTSTFTPNTTAVTTIAQTPSLPPGTWLVNVFYGYQTLAQVKRTYSISLTAGVHDTLAYIENFNVAGANGNLREAFSAVVEITISSAPILFLASNGTSTTSTNGSCYMSWTRIG